jgi:hypothetical protein
VLLVVLGGAEAAVAVAAGPAATGSPAVTDGVTESGEDCAPTVSADALLPPPTCAVPVESVELLPPPPLPAAIAALAAVPAADAPMAGLAPTPLTWPAPVDPSTALPLPTWAAPVEPDAVLPPPPPTVTGAEALAVFPWEPADADGPLPMELLCTAPVEPLDVLPPPIWTVPVELDAVLLPLPATDVGTETVALAVDESTLADGLTVVLPI